MKSVESETESNLSWHTTENDCDRNRENDNQITESSIFVIKNGVKMDIEESTKSKDNKFRIPIKKKYIRNISYRFPWMIFTISVIQVNRFFI